MNMQEILDKLLADNPELQKYIKRLHYVPQGEQPPPEATLLLALISAQSRERQLLIAVELVAVYAVLAEAMLALIATMPGAVYLPPIAAPVRQLKPR